MKTKVYYKRLLGGHWLVRKTTQKRWLPRFHRCLSERQVKKSLQLSFPRFAILRFRSNDKPKKGGA